MAMKRSQEFLRRLQSLAFRSNSKRRTASGLADLAELALRDAMAARRLEIKKASGSGGKNRSVAIGVDRFARDKSRLLKKKYLRKREWAIPQHLLLSKRRPSPILDRLDEDRPKRWKPIIARKFKRTAPRMLIGSLNFLDDPVATIEEFRSLSKFECSEVSAYLDFSDDHCVDAGAYLVLAEIFPQLSNIFRGGRMSLPVQKVLSAIRLDQELNISLGGVKDHRDIWAFPTRHRRPRGTTESPVANLQPQSREKVADQFCDLVDEWFLVADEEAGGDGQSAWELSPDGRSLIARMSGELLDNAERHSFPGSSDGDWSMTAFMAARDAEGGRRELRCYMAFLSTGQSIAEAMSLATPSLLSAAERYLGQFGRRGPSRDTLLTIIALQDAVTSDANALRDGRGGTGLQDVLEFVGDLGAADHPDADVRVTIVSGKSCIRLRHPHLVGTRDNNGRRVQWCNQGNDPTLPPDEKTAFDLPAHFAGTLVTAAFTLDPRLFDSEAIDLDDTSGKS